MATLAPTADLSSPQPDIVLVLDSQGTCHDCLTDFAEYAALEARAALPPREQAVGQPLAQLLPTSLALQIRTSLLTVQETPGTLDPLIINYAGAIGFTESALVETGGATGQRQYEIRLNPCGPDRFLCVIREMTAEATSPPPLGQLQHEHHSSLFTSSSFSIALTDAQGTIIEVNQAFASMLAYGPEDLIGIPITDLLVPETRALDQKRLAEHIADPTYLHKNKWIERRFLNRMGETIWVRMAFSIQRNVQGDARLLTFLAEDITATKAAAEDLQVRNQILELMPHGVIVIDARHPDLPVLYVNAGFEQLTGYSATEIVGKSCKNLRGFIVEPATAAKLCTAVEQRQPVLVELPNYHEDGTAFWNALSIMPIADERGQIAYYLGLQTDITDLKRRELQHRRSQKLEAVKRLAGGVAHEFNNILTVITNYSELVFMLLPTDSPLRNKIEQIQTASHRATHLTQQLLTFSRRQHSEPIVLDLNELLSGLENILKRLLGEETQLHYQLSAEPALVEADPGQIEQIITNLVVNARDAMPRGGQLNIQTERRYVADTALPAEPELLAGEYICLTVHDTGDGMDEETQSHIFEPFFSTKDVGQGSGLGLSMVFGIVKQHRGFIVVESQIDRGTSMRLYFPYRNNAVATPLSSTTFLSTPVAQSPDGTKMTVLIVEDEKPLLELMTMILEEHGYHVIPASDGAAALDLIVAREITVDLLLSDMLMPQMSGYDIYEQLMATQPDLKTILIIGYPENQVTLQDGDTTNLTFLSKPFTWQQLLQKVQALLSP